jgi:hypothetical protein
MVETKIGARVVQNVLEMKITRADGTVEDHGVVGYWHRNPLKRLMFRLKRLLSRR